MAQKVITELVDDLDGSEAEETVNFGYRGAEYTIDLSEENAERLRDALQPYIDNGRRLGRHGKPGKSRPVPAKSVVTVTTPVVSAKTNGTPARPDREQLAAIRDWARSQGMPVSDRGRIAADVRAAFDAAH